VGRYFPLTIAQLVDKVPAALGDDPWFEKAEMLSLDALADEFDPKTFSARLEALGAPDCSSEAPGDSGGRWWTLGARALPPLGLAASALPRGQAGTTLLDGDWARWGWEAQPIPFKVDPDAIATTEAPDD
jgi:hypothetical protein